MENKLSLTDIADLLSQRMGCTKKVAEQFLKELFGEASSVISSGENLKISGLGTFKSIWVAPRNSINVRTGESFEIPGHYKLSFTPDKKMKDAVNAPFADFETVILSDNVDLTVMTDIDAKDSENKIGNDIINNAVEKDPDSESEIINVPDVASTQSDVTENCNHQKKENVQIITDSEYEIQENDQENIYSATKKKYKWEDIAKVLKDIVVIVLMLVTVAGVGYVVYRIYQDRQELKQRKIALAKKKERVPILTVEEDSAKTIPADTILSEKKRTIIFEKISEGVTLAKLSLKHYGNKAFWVYIYLENKDKIANPDKIPVGASVSIPPKESYNIDADNQQSIEDAKALADKILEQTQNR